MALRRIALILLAACMLSASSGCYDPAAGFPGLLSSDPSFLAIAPGGSGAWDSGMVHAPQVMRNEMGYLLWYDGTKTNDAYRDWAIGVAMSQDGSTWVKWPNNPVLQPGPSGSWDSVSVHDPRVIRVGDRYMMWYSGFDGTQWKVGLATSDDGRRWTKYPQNPVLQPGQSGSWDDTSVAYSSVIYEERKYRMWYQGGDSRGTWRIGTATSNDGIHWEKVGTTPVLWPGHTGEWDQERVFTPTVLRTPRSYLMVYSGGPGNGLGYAVSEDGLRWRKDPRGPAHLFIGGVQILTPTALLEGDRLRILYAEQRDGHLSIRQVLVTAPR